MSNVIKGKFDFEVEGETYHLQFSVNGMCALESAAGCGAQAFLKRLEQASKDENLSFGDVRLLFCAGLQEHHEGLTAVQAGRLITQMGGIGPAMDLVGRSLAAAQHEQEVKPGKAAAKKPRGTA